MHKAPTIARSEEGLDICNLTSQGTSGETVSMTPIRDDQVTLGQPYQLSKTCIKIIILTQI